MNKQEWTQLINRTLSAGDSVIYNPPLNDRDLAAWNQELPITPNVKALVSAFQEMDLEPQIWEDGIHIVGKIIENSMSHAICGKCGKVEEFDKARFAGWLIARPMDHVVGHLMIRCPEHITDHARRACGLKQEYYHERKKAQQ